MNKYTAIPSWDEEESVLSKTASGHYCRSYCIIACVTAVLNSARMCKRVPENLGPGFYYPFGPCFLDSNVVLQEAVNEMCWLPVCSQEADSGQERWGRSAALHVLHVLSCHQRQLSCGSRRLFTVL